VAYFILSHPVHHMLGSMHHASKPLAHRPTRLPYSAKLYVMEAVQWHFMHIYKHRNRTDHRLFHGNTDQHRLTWKMSQRNNTKAKHSSLTSWRIHRSHSIRQWSTWCWWKSCSRHLV